MSTHTTGDVSPRGTAAPTVVHARHDTVTDDGGHTTRRWDGRWPVKGREIVLLLGSCAIVIGVFTMIGLAFTDWTAPNAITRFDDRLANALADHRTGFLNDVVTWVVFPANTFPKIAISTIICLAFLWTWRRWDEVVYVALPLVFEATAFVVTTSIVQRPRPDVDRLLTSTINSSFPSGHVAATTVYFAVVAVIVRHERRRWVHVVAWTVFALLLIGVAWARMYQGMHFLSDVLGGIVLGAVTLVITDHVLDTSRMRSAPISPGEPATG